MVWRSNSGAPLSVRVRPDRSRFRLSSSGGRPVATSRRSNVAVWPSMVISTPSAVLRALGVTPRCRGNSSRRMRASAALDGPGRPPTVSPMSNTSTRTPRRAIACASSTPMGPAPITPMLSGRSSSSNIVALVRTRSPRSRNGSGILGVLPVAMTMAPARTVSPFDRSSVFGPAKAAVACTRTSSGSLAMPSLTPCTNPSRMSRRRRITAGPSMHGSAWTPKTSARRASCAASAAAISSLDGMQPTLAQVVPANSGSISRVRAPQSRALRSADRPAVPAPITATSQSSCAMCCLSLPPLGEPRPARGVPPLASRVTAR